MKVLFAVFSLCAVAVFALRGDQARHRFSEVGDSDVESFRSGQTYKYRLDTQISSGFASISDQHAVTRLQAEALLHFQSERLVTLKLNDVVIGTLNQEVQEPERVQPFGMFKENQIKTEEARQLELPCTFDYVDGLVERVRFHQDDKSWSKNIKKSVLNMIQINMKQRQGENTKLEQLPEWKQERELETKSQSENRMFVMPETTLEGECQVSYTMNKMRPTNKFNTYNDNSRDEVKMFNVTKSINFRQCAKIADIQYGPKIEKACATNCTTEKMEERKLDRTTILRQVVVGTPEKYGIKKVELVSHYLFKMLNAEEDAPMHTIVAGELNYIRIEESRSELERGLRGVSTSGKEESLLYSIEWDEQEKRFYMYGDEEFVDNSPFEKVQDKVGKVEQQLKKLISMWSDKTTGIETEATFVYSKIVELVRMCNQEELRQIFSRISSKFDENEQRKAEDILIDALSTAGTHNTIKILADKIQRKEISQARAVRALVQLKDLPAPSEKQVKIITELCQSEVCKRHEPCRQVCWLTSGSIMGKLCSEDLTSRDALEQKKSPCHLEMKKEFVKKIMTQYSKVETRYEKILLLKTLGNAGLEPSVYELEKIIRDIREEPIVRMQAIDSLRRLRAVMPQKIQRVLMPIFQNVRERPEIRMMALSQIFATIPEKPILDQIGMTLIRDPSRQVRSYVYGAMQKLAESPIRVEKELARHLKGLNKLANINEEDEEVLLRGSRYYRIPVYSQARKEGFFVELESMVGTENVLPKHLSAGLDSYFNGLFQKNSLEVSFTQEDLEQWAEKLMNVYMDYQHGDSLKKSLRGYRSSDDSDSSEADKDFRSIVQGLGIKRRSSPRVDSDSETTNNSPYGMLCFRYGDIDYAVLPLEEEHLTPALKKLLINGEKPSPRDFEYLVDIVQGRPFRVQAAMHLLEHSIKIPTSMGLPVRMWHVIPVLASVEGQIKPKLSGSEVNVEVKLHPTLAISHLKRIEVWTPIVNTGVETSRTGMINLPINAQIQIRDEVKLSIEVPQNRFRALALNSMPFTFTSGQDKQQVVKRVENKNLIQRLQPIEKVYGKQNFGMPLKISGDVHNPQQWTYGRIVNTLMTSENHLQVVFDPTADTPREIRLTARGETFGQADRSSSNHRELKDFYSKSKFDTEMDQDFEEDRDSERRFSKFVDDFQPRKMYSHKMSVKIQTVGGRQEKEAQVDLEAACDSEHRYVKAKLNAKRSPLPSLDESSPWTMKTQVQAFLPETHSTFEQYKRQQGEKQQKLVCQVESEWGTDNKQKVSLNINGEQARSRQAERIESPQRQQQFIQKIAFLNKYDISAEYSQITPETKSFANYMSTLLKTWSFWNTKVELKSDSRRDSQREGQISATVVIDSMTHEHVNITLKTPVEIVRIDSMRLPMKVKPFKLVKPSQTQKSVDSFTELVHSYASESRPECKVDSRKIRSFDDAIFKAPLTKCYSVLAKDCRSENPRFAVLMKKIDEEQKAMKILSNGDRIEIQPKDGKLIVKINGRREENEETLLEHGIEATQDLVHFNSRDVTVRFDGEQALIKISPSYKNQQCGLCGHYNDNTEDDFRMSNNEMTSDIKSYHKSYSMVDDECREDLEKTHRDEEYKPLKDSRESYEEEPEQKHRRNNNKRENGLIEKTEVMEYNHKICFSLKPIKACPENSYPEKTKDVKISFTCLDRSSSEARRLLRETRRSNGPVDIRKEHKISFVETIAVPTTCAEY